MVHRVFSTQKYKHTGKEKKIQMISIKGINQISHHQEYRR